MDEIEYSLLQNKREILAEVKRIVFSNRDNRNEQLSRIKSSNSSSVEIDQSTSDPNKAKQEQEVIDFNNITDEVRSKFSSSLIEFGSLLVDYEERLDQHSKEKIINKFNDLELEYGSTREAHIEMFSNFSSDEKIKMLFINELFSRIKDKNLLLDVFNGLQKTNIMTSFNEMTITTVVGGSSSTVNIFTGQYFSTHTISGMEMVKSINQINWLTLLSTKTFSQVNKWDFRVRQMSDSWGVTNDYFGVLKKSSSGFYEILADNTLNAILSNKDYHVERYKTQNGVTAHSYSIPVYASGNMLVKVEPVVSKISNLYRKIIRG